MKKIKDVEGALKLFEEANIAHAYATESGDYKTCNKMAPKICQAIDYLKEHNALLRLKDFFVHSEIGPRRSAATYLLPVYEDESLKILSEISRQKGGNASVANIALEEWRKGGLPHIRALYK